MTQSRFFAAITFVLIISTVLLASWAKPTKYLADDLGKPDLETLFPTDFGEWRLYAGANIVLPAPDTQVLLNKIYNQTLTRTYINNLGYRIMLSVAYGGDQSDATRAHLPEGCYPAQGFQITSNVSDQLVLENHSLPIRRLMAIQGLRNEPITYWLIVGDKVAVSLIDRKMAQFELGLRGYIPDGMLVRVSSIDFDVSRGYRQHDAFLRALALALPASGQDRVFGASL